MLSKQEANGYYKDEVEQQRHIMEESTRQKLLDLYQKYQNLNAQHAQAQTTPPPRFRNAERASLAADGIVIEAGNGMERIVVRGDLLKTLATLVTMAQMAGLLAKDSGDDGQIGL